MSFYMLNFPNFFSIARIILILPLVVFLVEQQYGWAFVVFLVAALTDALDGTLARILHQRTVLGAYLDPAADKILVTALFVTLAVLHYLPGWLAVLVISRDLVIVAGLLILRATSHPLEVRPSIASKMTTIFQMATIGAVLLPPSVSSLPLLRNFFICATALVTVISGVQYVWNGIQILRKGKG